MDTSTTQLSDRKLLPTDLLRIVISYRYRTGLSAKTTVLYIVLDTKYDSKVECDSAAFVCGSGSSEII